MSKLSECPKCRDMSVIVKVYNQTEGDKVINKRVEYCVNVGCGYRKKLPFPEDYKR